MLQISELACSCVLLLSFDRPKHLEWNVLRQIEQDMSSPEQFSQQLPQGLKFLK